MAAEPNQDGRQHKTFHDVEEEMQTKKQHAQEAKLARFQGFEMGLEPAVTVTELGHRLIIT